MKCYLAAVIFSLASAMSLHASAGVITYTGVGTGPGGVAVSASAMFDITDNLLTITLKNTSPSNNGQDVPGSTLTGVFWNFTGNPVLTPWSATVAAGSIIGTCDIAANCETATNVGGEFGYQQTSLTNGADRGIASSGYLKTGLSKNIGNFNNGAEGTDLDKPISLDGINFGIISAATGYNANGGLEKEPVIKDTVVFTLSGVRGLNVADISNVSFQYGTALTELNVPGTRPPVSTPVPEPGTLAIFALGLMAFAGLRRRKIK
jgi:hypothetical protein